ncbi:MAG: aldo/keto reductase [Phycisphaerae bacterium]
MPGLNDEGEVSRRSFLKAGVTTAAAAGLPLEAWAAEVPPRQKDPLPRRVLGRTGEKVSMLNLGTAEKISERLLNAAYDAGIRYFDTADCYTNGASEKVVGEWMAKTGRRKEFFVVTKDHPKTPDEWVTMVDTRLEVLQTDYIDLFFIHGLGAGYWGGGDDGARDIPKMKEWSAAVDKMKKSHKVHFVGFSTHTKLPLRIELLNNAAAGGWVDAIMVAYDPQLVGANAEFNKALDACHKAGVGLICMKEMRAVAQAPKFMPEFKEMGLTPHQAVLHAVWSDERISSICSAMSNLKMVEENSTAARNFKPMDDKKIGAVKRLYERYAVAYCNGCDGRCQKAGGTHAALDDIVRYLSYYEGDGERDKARKLYASLAAEQRRWHGADLAAASAACVSKLDFASLLARAQEKLA